MSHPPRKPLAKIARAAKLQAEAHALMLEGLEELASCELAVGAPGVSLPTPEPTQQTSEGPSAPVNDVKIALARRALRRLGEPTR